MFRRYLNKCFKWLFFAASGLFVCLILVLNTPPGERFLLNRLTAAVNTQSDLQLRIDAYRFQGLGDLKIEGITLSLLEEDTLLDLLRMDELVVGIHWRSLLKRQLIVQNITCDGLFLSLSDSLLNQLQAHSKQDTSQSQSASTWEFDLHRLEIRSGELWWRQERMPLACHATEVNLKLEGGFSNQFQYQLSGAELAGTFRNHKSKMAEFHLFGKASPETNFLSSDLTWDSFSIDQVSFLAGRLSGKYEAQTVRVDTVLLSGPVGTFGGNARLILNEDPQATFDFLFEQISIETLGSLNGHDSFDYKGWIDGFIHGSVPIRRIRDWEVSGQFTAHDLFYKSRPLPKGLAAFVMQSGRVMLSYDHPDARVRFDGELDQTHFDGSFKLTLNRLDRLGAWLNGSQMGGMIAGHGTLDGSFQNPHVESEWFGRDLSYQNMHLDSLWLDAALVHHSVRFFHFVKFPLPITKEGLASQSVELKGRSRFSLETKQGTSVWFPASPSESQDSLALTAELGPNSDMQLNVTGQLESFGAYRSFFSGADIDGTITLRGDYRKQNREETVAGYICMQGPRWQKFGIDSVAAFFESSNRHKTRARATFWNGQDSLAVSGRLDDMLKKLASRPWKQWQSEGQIDLYAGRLATYQNWLPPDLMVAGSVNLHLQFQGEMGNPLVSGRVGWTEGKLVRNQKTVAEAFALLATCQNNHITLKQCDATIQQIPLSLNGRFSFEKLQATDIDLALFSDKRKLFSLKGQAAPDSIHLSQQMADLPVSILAPLVPDLHNLQGIARGKSEISVAGHYWNLAGDLRIEQLAFEDSQNLIRCYNGRAFARFSERQVFLDSLNLQMGKKGTFTGSGHLALGTEKINTLSMQMHARDIQFQIPKHAKISVKTADLAIQNRDATYQLTGDVQLGESRLTTTFQPRDAVSYFQKRSRPKQKKQTWADHLECDVRLLESPNLWIDNNLAKFKFQPVLEIVGPLSNVAVLGHVEVKEGYILYLDRKFQLTKGVFDFNDPYRINPYLDLEAVHTVRTYETVENTPYEITFTLSGYLDQATYTLSSDPTLDQANIFTLLTLGATRQSLTGNKESGVALVDALQDRFEVLSSRKITQYTASRMSALLGMETVSIEGNLFNAKGSGPQVVASRKLSPKMSLTYTTKVGYINEQSIRLNYYLSKFFSLEGQTDQKGNSGIDLKYRIQFK